MDPSRRFAVAVAASLAAHSLIFALPSRKPGEHARMAAAQAPMTVVIVAPAVVELPEPPPPRRVEEPRRATPAAPRPQARPPRPPAPAPRPVEPAPAVPEAPSVPPATLPPVDMLAMIEERRERRRAAEESRRRPPPVAPPDAATRNLQSLSGREGVSGVFQVLDKGVRYGTFAFNGWRPDARSRWREVYEVDAGPGGNVELAMVRRMIALIRTHYTGDFNWDSRRLGRVVVLSARPEDTEGLEDFLMREFFEPPVLKPR